MENRKILFFCLKWVTMISILSSICIRKIFTTDYILWNLQPPSELLSKYCAVATLIEAQRTTEKSFNTLLLLRNLRSFHMYTWLVFHKRQLALFFSFYSLKLPNCWYTSLTFVIVLNRLPTHFICVKIQCVFIDAKGKSKLSFYLLGSTFYCVKDEDTQTWSQ